MFGDPPQALQWVRSLLMGSDGKSNDAVGGSAGSADNPTDENRIATAFLEHLTGPSRGTAAWLTGSAVDVFLRPNRFLYVVEARAVERGTDLIARLHRAGNTYEIEAIDGVSLWVNKASVTTRRLQQDDIIEFGTSGPLSRFSLYRENELIRGTVGKIFGDVAAYLRVSRQPIGNRCAHAISQVVGRLCLQTTVLFRTGVVIAIVVLAGFAYQQSRLNALLQERLEISANRLENFAAALARARTEALTPSDLQSLRNEFAGNLSSTSERLKALERRSSAAERVIAGATPSVLFLQGAYGVREKSSGRMLRQVVDEEGRPLISPLGQPMLSLDGDGPVAERMFTGSAFAVGDEGILITNRHVALPWEAEAPGVAMLVGQGLEPVMIKLIAFSPQHPVPGGLEVLRVGADTDLAILRYTNGSIAPPGLKLADRPPKPGDEVFVMGYPTGLRSMLARSGDDFIEELQRAKDTGFWSVASRLAERGYIAPLASRGIIAQSTSATVVYDAATTEGGSGGPVLDANGAVIAVNTAVLPEFGGSNFGVPVGKLRDLLAAAGMM